MNKLFAFLKKEIVLCIALILGLFGIFLVKPTFSEILSFIDFRVLALLFCLMFVIQGFKSLNWLDYLALKILSICKTTRSLFFSLTFLVFFISMIVTNDVALLTFVPITLIICKRANFSEINSKLTIELIVLETIAANLGSCVTPMGNPQNLFLYSFYNLPILDFFATTLKIGIPSLILCGLLAVFFTRKNKKISVKLGVVQTKSSYSFVIFFVLLIASLLSVFRILDYRASFIVCATFGIVFYRKTLCKVDFSLLFTFVGFFIFTSSISKIDVVSNFLKSMLQSPFSTYVTGILTSQAISNVPAALLLSNFTQNAKELLAAVNVGGLGTLIASLASVISYKLYNATETQKGYFKIFSIWNFALLAILSIIVYLVL